MQCQLDDGNVYGLLSPFSHQTIFVHSPFTSLTTVILSIKPAKNSSLARFLNGNCFLVCCFPLLQARTTKCTTAASSVLSPLRKTSPPSALEVLLQVCRDVLNSHLSAGQAQTTRWTMASISLQSPSPGRQHSNSKVMRCRRLLDSGQHARVHHVACGLADKRMMSRRRRWSLSSSSSSLLVCCLCWWARWCTVGRPTMEVT